MNPYDIRDFRGPKGEITGPEDVSTARTQGQLAGAGGVQHRGPPVCATGLESLSLQTGWAHRICLPPPILKVKKQTSTVPH